MSDPSTSSGSQSTSSKHAERMKKLNELHRKRVCLREQLIIYSRHFLVSE